MELLMVALSKNEYNENVYWNLRQNFRQIEGTSALFWFKVNNLHNGFFFVFHAFDRFFAKVLSKSEEWDER